MERWLPVSGYEDRYAVSSLGRVKRLACEMSTNGIGVRIAPARILVQSMYNGFVRVGLNQNGYVTTRPVHMLVAEAFVPNPRGYKNVYFRDENRKNCRAKNLYWCDPISRTTAVKAGKVSWDVVRRIRKLYATTPTKIIVEATGLSAKAVREIGNNATWRDPDYKPQKAAYDPERNGTLTWAQVRRIREIGKEKTLAELASLFGVSHVNISSILNYRTWYPDPLSSTHPSDEGRSVRRNGLLRQDRRYRS